MVSCLHSSWERERTSRTGRPESTLYTLLQAFAARTMATVWIEVTFPKPEPLPSVMEKWRLS